MEGMLRHVLTIRQSRSGRYRQTNVLLLFKVTLQHVNGVSFSPDGKYVASCSWDKTVKIWEVQTKKCVATLKGHTGGVFGVSFSPDGRYVASCSEDKTVKIWEVQTNKCVATLEGHTNTVNECEFFS